MSLLNTLGLATDFVGVVLLGIDLVRVQRALKTDAHDRLVRFNEMVESNDTLQSYAKNLGRDGDWREFEYDEGRMVPVGGFDYDAARESFKESVDLSASVSDALATLAGTLAANHDADARTANASLKYSYLGLFLVLAGFSMQIASQFVDVDVAFLANLL